MKYCEDLLFKWDKRIQFEATLLFFFSVVSGSSFVSTNMFSQLNAVLNFIPLMYIVTMFSWWYLCKRLVFDTENKTRTTLVSNIISFALWIIISLAVSLGGWDEWGWETKDVDVPASDNAFRALNCLLVAFYVATMSYDYYQEITDRAVRIKVWTLFIWLHALVSFSYFVEWVVDAHVSGDHDSLIGRWMAMLGAGFIVLVCIPIFWQKKVNKIELVLLFTALMLYWWGSASLDCEFYADTADMTVMVGYQMLGTLFLLILLESLPTMSTEIYVLGTEMLIDRELDGAAMDSVVQPEMINVQQQPVPAAPVVVDQL